MPPQSPYSRLPRPGPGLVVTSSRRWGALTADDALGTAAQSRLATFRHRDSGAGTEPRSLRLVSATAHQSSSPRPRIRHRYGYMRLAHAGRTLDQHRIAIGQPMEGRECRCRVPPADDAGEGDQLLTPLLYRSPNGCLPCSRSHRSIASPRIACSVVSRSVAMMLSVRCSSGL